MTGLRKWAALGGIAAIALLATIMSASATSRNADGAPAPATGAAQTPAPAQASPAAPAKKETATEAANREASGKAKPGPWAYSGASGYTNYLGGGVGRSPVQPVKFPHPVHVNTLKINCVFCHNTAFKSPDPGLPATGTCMG